MNRILGIDFGGRRIGLSISDPLKIIAGPLEVIDRKIDVEYIDKIHQLIINNQIEKVIVGLPLSMKGNISIQTQKTLDFIEELKKIIDIPIETVDERMTSVEAKRILIEKGVKTGHHKSKVDMTSAIIILQEYLDSI